MPGEAVPATSWLARQDWFFALALAAFVGTAAWFSHAIVTFFSPAAAVTATPVLVGLPLPDAIRAAARVNVQATVAEREPSDRVPKNVVIRQDPQAGTSVREGRRISLVVSSGAQVEAMPDLRFESQGEAGLALAGRKLALGKTRLVSSDTVPAGFVVAQVPLPGTSVRAGTVVELDLAAGGSGVLRVPNVTGLSLDDARARIGDAHVLLGQVVWTPFGRFGPPRGLVVRQRPAPGKEIDPTQTLSLQVSAGPREAGYLVRQVRAIVTVPQPDPTGAAASGTGANAGAQPEPVRVVLRDETGSRAVYEGDALPHARLDLTVTAIGTAELDLYVNGELLGSTTLGVEPPLEEKQTLPPPRAGSHPSAAVLKDLRGP
ncbi:MAG: PASTA domain-containing protein [Vulcanimicrobiaceae bacterium]